MRFLVYLLTLFFVGTAVAQNPTILQGNYITNVFGQSNFVLNPNAQTNLSNTSTNAGVSLSRSTTTPLVATSEFNISTSSFGSTVYAEWTTRTFDAGMKNQNCEARFTYRGFAVATTTAQIVQGSNTVAQLVLTPSTDPRIASINFPCGDLSNATVFRIQQGTANLTGTNEIGGIYVGLATNQANVAQAEAVVRATRSTSQTIPNGTATVVYSTALFDNLGEYNTSNGRFTAKRAGRYYVSASILWTSASVATNEIRYLQINKNGSSFATTWENQQITSTRYITSQINSIVELAVGDYIEIIAYQNSGGNRDLHPDSVFNFLAIARFPTSSELVVTPERQNTWGGVVYTTGNQTVRSGQVASGTYQEFNKTDWNQPTMLKGKAAVTTTNSGNDLGFSIPNLPVGNYKLTIHGLLNASNQASTVADAAVACSFRIYETTTSSEIARQTQRDQSLTTSLSDQTRDYTNAFFGVFNNTSVGTRNFRLEAAKTGDTTTGGTLGLCEVYAATTAERTNIAFLIEPLDQPSNSALYVQGPVLGAQTGATISAGYVGELKACSSERGFSANTAGSTGWSLNANVASGCTLTPGVWLVNFGCDVNVVSGTTTGQRVCILTADSTDGWPPTSNLSNGNLNMGAATYSALDGRFGGSNIVKVTSSGIDGGSGFVLYGKMLVGTHTSFTGTYYFTAKAIRLN